MSNSVTGTDGGDVHQARCETDSLAPSSRNARFAVGDLPTAPSALELEPGYGQLTRRELGAVEREPIYLPK